MTTNNNTNEKPRKRVDIVRLELIKDGSMFYKYNGSRRLTSPNAVASLAREYLGGEPDREFMIAISINTKHEPVNITTVSQGSLNASIAHPREIFKIAIKSNAHALFLVHNHPSGDSEPSKEDISVTKRLMDAGDLLGIKVLDHIVLGSKEEFTSLMQAGVISR